MTGKFAHLGSAHNLCGDDNELKEKFNIFKYVNSDSAPIYVWHTEEDELVPVENTYMLAEAYNQNGLPIVMEIFTHGRHGQAIKDILAWDRAMLEGLDDECSKWLEKGFDFLQSNGFLIKE
jgi:dipeptidyl aminopeptidase/acylaminoacyl peptidase